MKNITRKILAHEPPAWLLILAIIFFIFLAAGTVSALVFESSYKNRVYPGVFLGKVNVGGLGEEEVLGIANNYIDTLSENGIAFNYSGKTAVLFPLAVSAAGESAEIIVDIDQEASTKELLSYGRQEGLLMNLKKQLSALINGQTITPHYTINENAVEEFLKDSFQSLVTPGQDAELIFKDDAFLISAERSGLDFNYQEAIASLEQDVSQLETKPITLSTITEEPLLKKADLQEQLAAAEGLLDFAPIYLTKEKNKWMIKRSALGSWLDFKKDEQGEIRPSLDASSTWSYIEKNILPEVKIDPMESRFEMKNGRASAFSVAKDGLTINATATLARIEEAFILNASSSIEIEMMSLPSLTSSSTVDSFGIKEIIGTGHSNFSGSPKNRRINISVGARALSGLVIAPGETFSVMKHLTPIDASSGYLTELVIKGDKTIPEYGGGLCQVGTTMFRAATESGLPIVERRNHSYRVGYYEPAGTDATIYDPAPDFKFKNDTNNHILIQTRIAGNDLYFDFWGTKDGRIIEKTKPTIYNIVKPKATKLIETTTLKPGVRKCTEKAHNGADAYFDYKVTYNTGEVASRRFSSHYVPWQEVCLIGAPETTTSSTTPINTASSTPTGTTSINNLTNIQTITNATSTN